MEKTEDDLNMLLLIRQPGLKNTERIIVTLSYAVMAIYEEYGKHWNFLDKKGPLLMIADKNNTKKLVLLSHTVSAAFEIIHINVNFKSELKVLDSGYMINYKTKDNQGNPFIEGIWSLDEKMLALHNELEKMFEEK